MARLLKTDEMTHEVFQIYYDCLRELYGVYFADFVLGAPKELEIPEMNAERLHHSYCSQTCAICTNDIPEDFKEDCTFEHLEGDANLFFICDCCQ